MNDRKGPRLSATKAYLLVPPRCPAIFKDRVDNPPPPTPQMKFGSLVHKVLFGVGDDYFIMDPAVHGLTKTGAIADNPRSTQKWKETEAKAEADGRIPVSVDDYRKAEKMAKVVRAHRWAGPLLESGEAEYRLEYIDPETGVLLVGRVDWVTLLPDGRVALVEYKSSATANPRAWARSASDFGYEVQAAFYKVLAVLMGIDADPVVYHIVQEKEGQYLASVVELDRDAMLRGAQKLRAAIDVYAECWVADKWPGWEDRIYVEGLPPWV